MRWAHFCGSGFGGARIATCKLVSSTPVGALYRRLMAGRNLFVSPESLGRGSGKCDDAAESALKGADMMATVSLPPGVFGDLPEAHDFHATATDLHTEHSARFRGHHAGLSDVAGKSTSAAQSFVVTDEQSAARLDQQM